MLLADWVLGMNAPGLYLEHTAPWKLKAHMAGSWHLEAQALCATWASSQQQRSQPRVKDRIKSLSQLKRNRFCGLGI